MKEEILMIDYQIFRVVKIIDNTSIVINGGIDKNLSINDEIEIFVEGEEIFDQFNENISLGTLDFIKEKLIIVELSKNYAVCAKFVEKEIYHPTQMEKITQRMSINLGTFGSGKTEIVKTSATFAVKQDEISGRTKADKAIQLGDFARIALS